MREKEREREKKRKKKKSKRKRKRARKIKKEEILSITSKILHENKISKTNFCITREKKFHLCVLRLTKPLSSSLLPLPFPPFLSLPFPSPPFPSPHPPAPSLRQKSIALPSLAPTTTRRRGKWKRKTGKEDICGEGIKMRNEEK